ncbi:uncharacterized protein LOC117168390 [Belonocnema kinseyi]|uniref:uncharacterized protein LOC117168390 n=1 Tax=Belonocnema kinseyi TaxID=2817044 RepID=UPI00143CF8B8|nr:uncharacterized protein LOC117168390 [Belonocnema kinseyi]
MGDKEQSHSHKNKQNRKPHAHAVKDRHSAKDVRVNLRKAKFKSRRQTEPESEFFSEPERIKPQPLRNRLSDDNISDVEESGQDFESLLNTPVSEGGHFTFKSEKDWNFNISESSQLFSLDLRLLNAAVSCIPFNECVEVEDTYFSNDQLTYMRSDAERAKENYEKIVEELSKAEKLDYSGDELDTEIGTDFRKEEKQKSERKFVESSEIQSLEKDLDFLLSLKEPMTRPMAIPQIASTAKIQESKSESTSAPIKSIDLEKWLESVLDI